MYKRILITILATFLFIGCNTQRKCQRFFKKHPKCFTSDTLVQYDTIKGIEFDTILIGRNTIDTFMVDSGGIQVQTIVRWKTKTLYQEVIEKDTILETKTIRQIPNPIVINEKPKWLSGLLISLFLFIVLLLGLVYLLFKK